MKKLIAVAETTMTRAGLLRPGMPYAMDPSNAVHAQALREILTEGGPGRVLTAEEATDLLAAGLRPLGDDGAVALFDPEHDEAADGELPIDPDHIEAADGEPPIEPVAPEAASATGKSGNKASGK